jgi:MerR family transcriptional regulator, light-induced transcriptional regulator
MASVSQVGSKLTLPQQGVSLTEHVSGESPASLAELIEGEIIPRLLLAHRRDSSAPRTVQTTRARGIDSNDVSAFLSASVENSAHLLIRQVDALLSQGVAVETILVDLLTPVARGLGEQWENDEIDFIDVTMGLWRLQEVVHDLAARVPGAGETPANNRRALFTIVPGDQHSFGTVLIDECFRRRGWDTMCVTSANQSQLVDLVGERWFEVIGLTVSCDAHIDELPRLIGALRKASRNPHVGVLVGGRVFLNNSDLALRMGADATAQDARTAVDRAEQLVEDIAGRAAFTS